MPSSVLSSAAPAVTVRLFSGRDVGGRIAGLEAYLARRGPLALSRHPRWLTVLERGLGHVPYLLEAAAGAEPCGFLSLVYLRSLLFGRFLVSLPYLNYGGAVADDEAVARALLDHAVGLAERLGVRFLELRHEGAVPHPAFAEKPDRKVHMRLALPATAEELWKGLPAKVRNQVRKGQKSGLTVSWGGAELLPEFYGIFSHNMRDLGTPVYGRALFGSALREFPGRAELCVVRAAGSPAAAALLLHGRGVTEVPSASSLRSFKHTCANMLLYWHLLERAVGLGQREFDFGRTYPEGNNFRFKQQWGARPAPASWQYYMRHGTMNDMRPENPRYQRFIRIWRRLPVSVTRLCGPWIVRGIP
jgi:FemAB-related protein (PEP-CTERM system-associated)